MVEPIRFGFLNEPLSVSWRYGTIRPVPNFEEIASCFEQSAGVYKGWVYPPIKAVDGQGAAAKKAWVPTPFSLPSSHILTLNADVNPAHSDFFIALFGFCMADDCSVRAGSIFTKRRSAGSCATL